MALGRQVHDGVGLEALNHVAHLGRVDDIGTNERITGMMRNGGERFKIAGIGQLVDYENGVATAADRMAYHCRADESRASGSEDAARHCRVERSEKETPN